MDNNTSDKLTPNYNIVQQKQNQFTLASSSLEKPKYEVTQQNNYNPDLNAPNPILNSQANNQAQPYPYNPNLLPNVYLHNPNIPLSQNSPYYNVTIEYPTNRIIANPQDSSRKCALAKLLIMSILMFIFLTVDILVISSIGEVFKNFFIYYCR